MAFICEVTHLWMYLGSNILQTYKEIRSFFTNAFLTHSEKTETLYIKIHKVSLNDEVNVNLKIILFLNILQPKTDFLTKC